MDKKAELFRIFCGTDSEKHQCREPNILGFINVFSVFFCVKIDIKYAKIGEKQTKYQKQISQFEKVNKFLVILMAKMFNLDKKSYKYIGTNLVDYTGQKMTFFLEESKKSP